MLILLLLASDMDLVRAQDCQQICEDYKSYARRAGDPRTMEPLLKLYQACMACTKGPGDMQCSNVQTPGNGMGTRCEYGPNNQGKDGAANR